MFFQKIDILFQREMARTFLGKYLQGLTFPEGNGKNILRKIPPRFDVSPPIPPEQKWHVVQHKKFPKKVTKTQKKKDADTESYEENEITKRNALGKTKINKESERRSETYFKENQNWKEGYKR